MIAFLKKYFTLQNIAMFAVIYFCIIGGLRGCKDEYVEYFGPDPFIEKQKDSIKQEIHAREIEAAKRGAEEEQLKKEFITNQTKLKEREKEIIKELPDNKRISAHKQFLRDIKRSTDK